MAFWDFGYGSGSSNYCRCDSCKNYIKKDDKSFFGIDFGSKPDKTVLYKIEIIGESKMETKKHQLERLLKSIAEMKQREVDNKKTLEEMQKEVENLQNQIKEEEQLTVSATGVILNSDNPFNRIHKWYVFANKALENCADVGDKVIYFSTKEQAEQEALRIEGQEFIRRCAMLWNKDHDWRKKIGVEQYYIYIDEKELSFGWAECFTRGEICFDNRELVKKCIAELKAKYNEEQIKTIFGVK